MAVVVCPECRRQRLAPGRRNERLSGLCGAELCWARAAMRLAEADLLSREEGDRLAACLLGEDGPA